MRVSEAVYKKGGGQLHKEVLAKELGNKLSSSSFIKKIAAAKRFGLVEKEGDLIRITDLSKAILSPVSQEEKNSAMVRAFTNFGIFDNLFKRYSGEQIPKRDTLANILEREYKIPPSSKSRVADVFISSGRAAGIIIEKGEGLWCKKAKGIPEEVIKIEEKVEKGKKPKVGYQPIFMGVSISPEMSEEQIRKVIRIVLDEIKKVSKENE